MSAPSKRTNQLRSLRLVLATAYRAEPRRTVAVFLLGLLELSTIAQAYVLKLLVDAALAREGGRAAAYAILLATLAALLRAGSFQGVQVRTLVSERMDLLIDQRIMELSSTLPGIEHYERPDYRSKLEMLRFERSQLTQTLGTLALTVSLLVRAVGTVVLLLVLNPWLALLPLFAVPALLAGRRGADIDRSAKDRTLEHWYQATQLFTLSTTASAAKELRVFGLQEAMPERHRRLWEFIENTRLWARLRGGLLAAAGWLVFGVGFVLGIGLIVLSAARGQASPGDVAAALAVAVQLNAQIEGLVGTIGRMLICLRAAERYLWLNDYAAPLLAPRRSLAAPSRLEHGIDVEDVHFRYPGTGTDVLAGVSLHIPAGSTLAVVGENGAGKTTLVKLLCRFYDPAAGRILVDGTDLREFDTTEWRGRISAGFQDFVRFELLLYESVGIGDLPRVEDRPGVLAALERARAGDVVEAVPGGLDAPLGRSLPDGVELSGGQWQKLALSRALMRRSPLLLVFDEPTSSLDAETEYELLDRYVRAARVAARDTGGITVIVSHRFSTVRMADLIAVVDRGRLVEVGGHDELIVKSGVYAELYELQARGYR